MTTPAAPPKVHEHHDTSTPLARLNATLAVAITRGVGTMWAAYAFALLALVGLPGAVEGGLLTIVQWVAQTFLQLVLLAVLAVGQNVAAAAADARADATFRDTETLLAQHAETRAALTELAAALVELRRVAGAPRRNGLVELRPRPAGDRTEG